MLRSGQFDLRVTEMAMLALLLSTLMVAVTTMERETMVRAMRMTRVAVIIYLSHY